MIRAGAVLAAFFGLLSAETPPAVHPAPKTFAQMAREASEARAGNRFADSIRLYNDAVRLRPSWSEGWWSLGTLYYDEDRFEEARAAFAHFVAVTPEPAPALGLLALCEYETREYDAAMAHFAQWAAKEPPASNEQLAVGYFHWALLLIRSGQFERATLLLNARAKIGNSGPALEEAMGLAALRIARLPEDYPPEEREPVWLAGKAEMQVALRHLERAEQDARKLQLHHDAHPNVHYFLGTILLDAHQNENAAKKFARELEVSPRNAAAMVQLAMFHMGNGEPAKALSMADRAIATEPGNFPAHKIRGDALFELEQYPESVRELELARGMAPESAPVRYALARVYTALGREADAKREREAFTELKNREREKTSK